MEVVIADFCGFRSDLDIFLDIFCILGFRDLGFWEFWILDFWIFGFWAGPQRRGHRDGSTEAGPQRRGPPVGGGGWPANRPMLRRLTLHAISFQPQTETCPLLRNILAQTRGRSVPYPHPQTHKTLRSPVSRLLLEKKKQKAQQQLNDKPPI